MNSIVRQLAERAVNSISDQVDFDIPDVFKEKFAELIVRECYNVAEEHDYNLSGNGGEILTHFGVE